MIEPFITTLLAIIGLLFGSFAGAMVWRLRARQLLFDKSQGEPVDAKEYIRLKPLTTQKVSTDRSRCLHCGYVLRWYDLVPLVSWVSLKGRCRSCHKRIGWLEPFIEFGTATLFVVSYVFWPQPLVDVLSISAFVTWLVAAVGLVILFAYDAKWFLLPDKVTWTVVVLGGVSVLLMIGQSGDIVTTLGNAAGAVAALSGLYLVLYLISKGQWIGFGDVKLGLGLGLLLADWQLGLLALFLANVIGCLVVLPLMVAGKVTRTTHVPFGPLLIVGAIIAKLFGFWIVEWYLFVLI